MEKAKSTVRVVADNRKIVSAVVTKKTFVSARAGGDAFRTRRKRKGNIHAKLESRRLGRSFLGRGLNCTRWGVLSTYEKKQRRI